MVHAASLTRTADDRYTYGEPYEEDAETLEEFLGDVAPGITHAPAPEIAALVDGLRGGQVFRVTDENAREGLETVYLVAWEGAPTG